MYAARICWNTDNWRRPTNEAAQTETRYANDESRSYTAREGFGHEEWLFRLEWLLDGYHCAFLQPVAKSRRVGQGQISTALLYTVDPNKQRWAIGTLRFERLQDADREYARSEYERMGWLEQMRSDLKRIGVDPAVISIGHTDYEEGLFNIRFRPEDWTPLEPPRPLYSDHPLFQRSHYLLYEIAEVETDKARRSLPQGRQDPLPEGPRTRACTPSVTYDPRHTKIQNCLFKLLQAEYGVDCVFEERGYVDIDVDHPSFSAYIEVKTASGPLDAIRQALGQIIEYTFLHRVERPETPKLVVAAPWPPSSEANEFLDYLRSKFSIDLSYCYCHEDIDELPDALART